MKSIYKLNTSIKIDSLINPVEDIGTLPNFAIVAELKKGKLSANKTASILLTQLKEQIEKKILSMRRTVIILLLILLNCKNETLKSGETTIDSEVNAKNTIDQSVMDMWQSYTSSNPKFKNDDMPESWYFHNNEADANRLAELVVSGKKKAGSGLYYMYKEAKVDLPCSGTKHIITNFSGKAKAIIEIVKVDTIPFNKITKEYASIDMGTNIEPLKKWRKAHWEFFSSVFKDSEEKPTENMLVVCERFETIWINNNISK